MNIIQPPIAQQILEDAGSVLRVKIVAIGAWDMDTDATKPVAHGLTLANIQLVTGYITQDGGSKRTPIGDMDGVTSGVMNTSIYAIDSVNVNLSRRATSIYDSILYDSVADSRGNLFIFYTV